MNDTQETRGASTVAPLSERIDAARAALDRHVREMVAWHFDPATGSPFWLEYAANLDFDPRKEIGGFDEEFGTWEEDPATGSAAVETMRTRRSSRTANAAAVPCGSARGSTKPSL